MLKWKSKGLLGRNWNQAWASKESNQSHGGSRVNMCLTDKTTSLCLRRNVIKHGSWGQCDYNASPTRPASSQCGTVCPLRGVPLLPRSHDPTSEGLDLYLSLRSRPHPYTLCPQLRTSRISPVGPSFFQSSGSDPCPLPSSALSGQRSQCANVKVRLDLTVF